MAESIADRLKRIAAEKKAAREKAELIELVTENSEANLEARTKLSLEKIKNDRLEPVSTSDSGGGEPGVTTEVVNRATEGGSVGTLSSSSTGSSDTSDTDSVTQRSESSGDVEQECRESGSESGGLVQATETSQGQDLQVPSNTSSLDTFQSSSGTSSDHPLAMQFAELEQLLLTRDPEFKVILRQVHRHLGQDAELVTQMTEEEISLVVTGLVLFANTEIVEVAKAKSVKKAVAEAKKKVISADDL